MEEKRTVYQVTQMMIQKLEKEQAGGVNAILAALRNSVGKPLVEADQVWPFLFENLPKSFLGSGRNETFEEAAVFAALQIYALCKQGSSDNVLLTDDNKISIGASLKAGRNTEDSSALDKRFNAMLTSVTLDEYVYHLRHLVNIVKAKNMIRINFAKLANDLYWLQKARQKPISFQWATDYYSYQTDKEKSETE